MYRLFKLKEGERFSFVKQEWHLTLIQIRNETVSHLPDRNYLTFSHCLGRLESTVLSIVVTVEDYIIITDYSTEHRLSVALVIECKVSGKVIVIVAKNK